MKLTSNSLLNGAPISARFAFCKPDAQTKVTLSDNLNPHLAWSDLPEGTRSIAVVCVDPDVPSRGDDVNQEGREVPSDLPRVDFYHWALVDVDPAAGEIAEGAHSSAVVARGKSGPNALGGARHGVNDYTGWFAGDEAMGGDYYGYDGPCPPWNDSIIHHYHFKVFALDVARCPVEGRFTGAEVLKAIQGHTLASASIVGTYTLNARLID